MSMEAGPGAGGPHADAPLSDEPSRSAGGIGRGARILGIASVLLALPPASGPGWRLLRCTVFGDQQTLASCGSSEYRHWREAALPRVDELAIHRDGPATVSDKDGQNTGVFKISIPLSRARPAKAAKAAEHRYLIFGT